MRWSTVTHRAVAGLQNDIDEIETEVLAAIRRCHAGSMSCLARSSSFSTPPARPLLEILNGLASGFSKCVDEELQRYLRDVTDHATTVIERVDEELQRYLRDVTDHATTVIERVDGFRPMLEGILTVNATLVGQRQNEEMRALTEASFTQNEEIKKVSAWAAILFAPTVIGTVYGRNFDHMPELGRLFGYPFALSLILFVSLTLYMIFKWRGWL